MTALLTRTPTAERSSPGITPLTPPPAPPPPVEKPARLVSLDAYRGFIMLAMVSAGLAIPQVSKALPADHPLKGLFAVLAYQTDHVPWIGCAFWDLIQPSFMFMVGVAVPYSYAARKNKGATEGSIWLHTFFRAALLVLLGVFLSSNGSPITNWTFVNVLTQIGLGYPLLCALRGTGRLVQSLALVSLLVGYWLLFLLWPLPPEGFDPKTVGSTPEISASVPGFFAHWDKNTNAAAAFDEHFLNWFPRRQPFVFNEGGYQTLNFIPSLATMLLGLMAGEFLRGPGVRWRKFLILLAAGAVCLAVGRLAGELACPLVKRIWTPSWAVYSSGWTFLMLALFYGVIDVAGWKNWTWPLVVVGMNSIAMYCMSQLLKGWVRGTLTTHIGGTFDGRFALGCLASAVLLLILWVAASWVQDEEGRRRVALGLLAAALVAAVAIRLAGPEVWQAVRPFEPVAMAAAVTFVLWLVCAWMYRRGVFLRI